MDLVELIRDIIILILGVIIIGNLLPELSDVGINFNTGIGIGIFVVLGIVIIIKRNNIL